MIFFSHFQPKEPLSPGLRGEGCQQFTEPVVLDLEMAEGQLPVDLVMVASPGPGAGDIACLDQVGHDSLNGSQSDSGPLGYICHSDRGVLSHA